jgi:hypothetical protein
MLSVYRCEVRFRDLSERSGLAMSELCMATLRGQFTSHKLQSLPPV